MLAFGIWRGPRRYEVHFVPFAEPAGDRPGRAEAAIAELRSALRRRLEAMCREHPYNWFNFYDFWQEGDA